MQGPTYQPALAAAPTGTRLTIRLQPRASRNEVVGIHGDALRIRVAAPPVDGAANEALLRFLADELGIAPRSLTITAGEKSRTKIVLVSGITPTEVASRLRLA